MRDKGRNEDRRRNRENQDMKMITSYLPVDTERGWRENKENKTRAEREQKRKKLIENDS
jgi:hypothetical protein